MHNTHERFGALELTKRVKDTLNEVRVFMYRLILEQSKDSRATAHLISAIGGDAEIGVVWTAVIEGAVFRLRIPRGEPLQRHWDPMRSAFAAVWQYLVESGHFAISWLFRTRWRRPDREQTARERVAFCATGIRSLSSIASRDASVYRWFQSGRPGSWTNSSVGKLSAHWLALAARRYWCRERSNHS